ncbi:MAG: hopanoid biosynthesis associated radical SAM protein HpnJ [Armatimonadetes bacterium]|nr:hopanoid biosynthesis associated radical SAM protein HpnJ [Armatimonadota bacterium]
MKKTLFLNPPSFEGFDGGAGSRYQARREIRSFWYPTWLAQPAACIPNSRLVDAPPDDLTLDDVARIAREGFELCIIHTSTPSFASDLRVAERLKRECPQVMIGMVGAHVAVKPRESLEDGRGILEFVARKEFDFTIRDIAEGAPLSDVTGISYLNEAGQVVHNPERPIIEDMDTLPFVVDVYKRDLSIENYAIGYLKHPYLSLYTGRGCPAQCTFCLWPQTIGGHRYRTRRPETVYEEMKRATHYFPQVKEFFFDDDTFTADRPRTEAIARLLGKLGIEWSCNSRANVPYETLKVMKENGLRLLLVGFESGNDRILRNIKKGVTLERARRFMQDCHRLDIKVHGTFILGLPGETRETIRETIEYAKEIDPWSIQVSMAAAYPGTEFYAQAVANHWLLPDDLITVDGIQDFPIQYPDLPRREVYDALEEFYMNFYLRPKPIFRMIGEMLKDAHQRRRRLHEAKEFFQFLRQRRRTAHAEQAAASS